MKTEADIEHDPIRRGIVSAARADGDVRRARRKLRRLGIATSVLTRPMPAHPFGRTVDDLFRN